MMTRAEVEAILAGTKGVTPGPWVPIHNADQHGMIRSEVRQQDDDPTNKHHWPFRVAQTVAGQFANADRANFDYLARLDPQTVSALCTSLLSHMDRVEELEGRPDDATLDERMTRAGMIPLTALLNGETPLEKWHTHTGVKDLNTFEQWLMMRYREVMLMRIPYELGEKDKSDEMYEWVLGHVGALTEVVANFRAARKALAQGGSDGSTNR